MQLKIKKIIFMHNITPADKSSLEIAILEFTSRKLSLFVTRTV